MYSYGPPHMAKQKQDDQLELTYSSYVRTQDVTLKTCQRRWMIGRSGERGSGISVLAARHDDDDDDDICVEKLITTIQVEGMIYWEVNTIAFRFYWTIIRTMRGDINNDGSAEPKRYRVDLSINHSFHLDRCYRFFYILSDYNLLFTLHIYIYIYIYKLK